MKIKLNDRQTMEVTLQTLQDNVSRLQRMRDDKPTIDKSLHKKLTKDIRTLVTAQNILVSY